MNKQALSLAFVISILVSSCDGSSSSIDEYEGEIMYEVVDIPSSDNRLDAEKVLMDFKDGTTLRLEEKFFTPESCLQEISSPVSHSPVTKEHIDECLAGAKGVKAIAAHSDAVIFGECGVPNAGFSYSKNGFSIVSLHVVRKITNSSMRGGDPSSISCRK